MVVFFSDDDDDDDTQQLLAITNIQLHVIISVDEHTGMVLEYVRIHYWKMDKCLRMQLQFD